MLSDSQPARIGFRVRRVVSGLAAACAVLLVIVYADSRMKAQAPRPGVIAQAPRTGPGMLVGRSYHNDTTPPLREMVQLPPDQVPQPQHEAIKAPPFVPRTHIDEIDPVVQSEHPPSPNMPSPILNFNGVSYPGGSCF